MEEEMLAFFPNGIRALVVDDDPKFVKSATVMLSLLNFKVATCGSPISALRLLTSDSPKDIDVVLSNAHMVANCGFDFRDIIEPDLRIPVIYIFSPETPIDADGMFDLVRTIHTATYVIKKPLDAGEVVTLWRVVAWRKSFLDAKMAHGGNGTAPAVAGGQGGSLLPLLNGADDDDDDDDREEGRVHFKVVKSGGSRKRRSNSGGDAGSSETQLKHRVMWIPCLKPEFERAVEDIGIEGYPSKILEHMNVGGLEGNHVASYLQQYRNKQLKKNSNSSTFHRPDGHPPQESLFVQTVLQTFDITQYNPKIFADGAGPSNVAAAAAFYGNDAPALAPLPPVFQQPFGNASDDVAPAAVMPAEGQQSFGGNDGRAPAPWLPVFQQPAVNVSDNIAPAAPPLYAGGQIAFPELLNLFGPFTYQGPPPPAAQNMFLAQGVMEQQREAEIRTRLEQPVGDLVAGALGNCAGSLVAPPSHGAAPREAALGELFNMAESLVAPYGDVALASAENEALMEAFGNCAEPFVAPHVLAMPAAEENAPAMGAPDNTNCYLFVASGNGTPAVASGDQDELAPMVAADEDFMFPLDALLGLDMPVDVDGGFGQQGAIDAGAGAGDFLNGQEGETGDWYLGTEGLTPLDEIFRDTTGDFMMPNDMAERE